MKSNVSTDVIDVNAIVMLDDPTLDVSLPLAILDVKAQLAVFDPVKQAFTELASIIDNTPYDINTAAGDKVARDLRGRCVALRTGTDKLYAKHNAPLLEAGRQMRAVKSEIERGIEPYEAKLDSDIKAQEKVVNDERQRKVDADLARVAALRARINAIAGLPAQAALLGSRGIFDLAQPLQSIDADTFEEFADEAGVLADTTYSQLVRMMDAAAEREAETERNRLESVRLETERQQLVQQAADAQAELKRITDAAAEAARLVEAQAAAERARCVAEAAQRQRDADAASAMAAKALATQRDAFEDERQAALESRRAERAALAEQGRVIQAQLAALEAAKNPAPVAVAAPQPVVLVSQAAAPTVVMATFNPYDKAPEAVEEPDDFAMADVIAEHYDVDITVAIQWLSRFDAQAAAFEASLNESLVA